MRPRRARREANRDRERARSATSREREDRSAPVSSTMHPGRGGCQRSGRNIRQVGGCLPQPSGMSPPRGVRGVALCFLVERIAISKFGSSFSPCAPCGKDPSRPPADGWKALVDRGVQPRVGRVVAGSACCCKEDVLRAKVRVAKQVGLMPSVVQQLLALDRRTGSCGRGPAQRGEPRSRVGSNGEGRA